MSVPESFALSARRWRCGDCDTWNGPSDTRCHCCGSPAQRSDSVTTPITPAVPAVSAVLEVHDETLLAAAARLEADWYTGPRMWHGSSGEPVTGEQAAGFLRAAAAVLEREGWEPGAFGLWEALDGHLDLKTVAVKILELVICAHTGAGAAEPRLWDLVPGRTAAQVLHLLHAGAAYADRHGPRDAAPSSPSRPRPDGRRAHG
ncbi:hypothetical protein ACIPPJ_30170 [Streptomyces sp. NPDC086091]|uniref:hypothetical protein n=1 Tax=Streptomyces sp. NPDC086091 TaxID=3365751 RepID=UPI0037FF0933